MKNLFDKLTPEQLDYCVRERPVTALIICADKLTAEQFDYCVHRDPTYALKFCADKLTPEQLDYCVRERPVTALKFCADKLTEEQKQYCEEKTMENLSIEAKEIINEALEKGYSPNDIKEAMEDGAYLSEAGISGELSEEVHFFLTKTHIYEAIVNFYDENDNVIKSAEVFGCNEKEINGIIEKSISEERDPSIVYGKIKNFCALK